MRWLEGSPIDESQLRETQVPIYNYYSAINFKDIMLATGRISAEVFTTDRIEQDYLIGCEFAGLDPKGRRVMGIVDNRGIATHVRGDSQFLWTVPESWSLEDAATIPILYSTVIYALLMAVDLKPKSTVLIHSGTGGIGLAALNVCLHHQFEVYVTVGTRDKRDYLRKHYPQIPESHIGNSRDTSFEEMIKAGTNSRGVDAVLNSLSEDKLRASVRCLARGGRFLEIGKFDLANDSSLNLLLIERGASYHGIMLDRIFKNSPELKVRLVDALYKGVQDGYVKPLPRVVFDRDELVPAFKYMTTGKHIGKVLVKVRDEGDVRGVGPKRLFPALPRFTCELAKSYVIIGGLGGVGLELADWLVLREAKKLVLVSRSGVRTGYQAQRIRLWRSYGVEVVISTRDVTTKQGCLDLINEATELGPIDAIFNLAVVLKDALLKDQTEDSFRLSLASKAGTTTYLDQITREICPHLRYFVIFSSVSCGRGNAGQTNYGMANSIMERICERRKRDGFPALAIQWGAIGDVGLVAKMQKENKEVAIGGTFQQKISSCLEVLDRFLKQDNAIVSSMVVAEKRNRGHGAISAVEAVANVLGIKDIKTVSQHATLAELGIDSMVGTEVVELLEKEFETYFTTKDVRCLTFAKLTEIESKKQKVGKEKTQQGIAMFMQFLPDSQADRRPIVKLSGEGQHKQAQTVLVFPGIQGVFTRLSGLVESLQARVLGVQYSYQEPEDSIEGIAKTIFPHVEDKISRDQPLTLIGYSFGTLVSLEFLSLLESRGYAGKLVLIDGSPTYTRSSILKSVPGDTEVEFQKNLVYKIFSMLVPVDLLAPYKAKFLKCSDFDEMCDLALTLIPSEVAIRQKLEKQAMVVLYKRLKAAINYEYSHDKIQSRAYLFKAKYAIVSEEGDCQLSKVCEHSVQVVTVDGDHVTILSQPELVQGINKIVS